MKSRHLVTIAVFLLGATLLGGVYLKLRDTQAADAENRGSDESAVVDSARTAASSTVGAAFAAGIAVPVEAARADRGTFTIWVSAEGQATALRSAPLQAEVVGSVTAVTVVEGQFVRRGQKRQESGKTGRGEKSTLAGVAELADAPDSKVIS